MPFKRGHTTWNKGKRIPLIERFMRFVEKQENGCWIWKGGKSGRGYGYFFVEIGNQPRAHRFSYEHHKGAIPEGMFVCHACDVPLCVNPEHLWVGTPKENTQDYISKGHPPNGEGNNSSKLTQKDVDEIRRLYATGEYAQQQIARMFGVAQVTVSAIARHRIWH